MSMLSRCSTGRVPMSVPTAAQSGRVAGKSRLVASEMMTEDAKFALGF
jgi:hypothetical protein